MENKHILSLEIPTVSNCDLLCIKDTSQYSKELNILFKDYDIDPSVRGEI